MFYVSELLTVQLVDCLDFSLTPSQLFPCHLAQDWLICWEGVHQFLVERIGDFNQSIDRSLGTNRCDTTGVGHSLATVRATDTRVYPLAISGQCAPLV